VAFFRARNAGVNPMPSNAGGHVLDFQTRYFLGDAHCGAGFFSRGFR
jgi:hypothetical protein